PHRWGVCCTDTVNSCQYRQRFRHVESGCARPCTLMQCGVRTVKKVRQTSPNPAICRLASHSIACPSLDAHLAFLRLISPFHICICRPCFHLASSSRLSRPSSSSV